MPPRHPSSGNFKCAIHHISLASMVPPTEGTGKGSLLPRMKTETICWPGGQFLLCAQYSSTYPLNNANGTRVAISYSSQHIHYSKKHFGIKLD